MRMNWCLALFAIYCPLLGPGVHGQTLSNEPGKGDSSIEQLLSLVPDGATWQDLAPDLRAGFERRASIFLAQDRRSWGSSGLQDKENLLLSAPTAAMMENVDRVLSVTYASELPAGFKMARDVQNVDLKELLTRVYLGINDGRGYMLFNHPGFRGWDGQPVNEVQLLDHQHVMAMARWQQQTEAGLQKIADDKLTQLEKALRLKSYFLTRAGKYFDNPAVADNGTMSYAGLYKKISFPSDAVLLDAYNSSMFSEFREVNMGTLDDFIFDYDSEFDKEYLARQGMPDALVADVVKLAKLYRTRVQSLAGKSKRCTISHSLREGGELGRFYSGANFKCRRFGDNAILCEGVRGHCRTAARDDAIRRAPDIGTTVSRRLARAHDRATDEGGGQAATGNAARNDDDCAAFCA